MSAAQVVSLLFRSTLPTSNRNPIQWPSIRPPIFERRAIQTGIIIVRYRRGWHRHAGRPSYRCSWKTLCKTPPSLSSRRELRYVSILNRVLLSSRFNCKHHHYKFSSPPTNFMYPSCNQWLAQRRARLPQLVQARSRKASHKIPSMHHERTDQFRLFSVGWRRPLLCSIS